MTLAGAQVKCAGMWAWVCSRLHGAREDVLAHEPPRQQVSGLYSRRRVGSHVLVWHGGVLLEEKDCMVVQQRQKWVPGCSTASSYALGSAQ